MALEHIPFVSDDPHKEVSSKLKLEITIFLIFLGTLVSAGGVVAYTLLQQNPYPLWDLDRHLAIGVPFILLGLLHLIAGIGFGITAHRRVAYIGLIASCLLAIFYFVFMYSATGKAPINLVSVLVVAVPVVLWMRIAAFTDAAWAEAMAEDDDERHGDSEGEGPGEVSS